MEEKCSKKTIMAMVCANASGSEKGKLLIIKKFQNLRCFKNSKSLPADYCCNHRALITSSIFKDLCEEILTQIAKFCCGQITALHI